MKYILAHDPGHLRQQKPLCSAQRAGSWPVKCSAIAAASFNTNWAEQDPEDWWRAICVTSRNPIEEGRYRPRRYCRRLLRAR